MPTATTIPIVIGSVVAISALGFLAIRFYPQQKPPESDVLTTLAPTATSNASPTADIMVSDDQLERPDPQDELEQQVRQPSPLMRSGRTESTAPSTPTPETTKRVQETTPTNNNSDTSYNLAFIDLPGSVRSGQSFTIAWQVTGPSGATGSNTTLKVTRRSSQQTGNSSSNSNSTSSQSFGSFTTPATFDADFTFAGDPGDIQVEVSATIGGKTITKQATIAFQS